jgi:hypothetical protein
VRCPGITGDTRGFSKRMANRLRCCPTERAEAAKRRARAPIAADQQFDVAFVAPNRATRAKCYDAQTARADAARPCAEARRQDASSRLAP